MTSGTGSATAFASPGSTRQERRRWWVLVVIGLAQLLVTLDTMVVIVALPSAQSDLGFTDSNRSWILTAYTMAFGSLLMLSGRLADRFGRKNIFIIGLVGFALASGIGGTSVSFVMLAASRAVQGLFAALLAPAALALLTTIFPSGRDRARGFAVFGALSMAGGSIGLIVGGLLTEYASWRWTMYISLVFAIPAIVGAVLLLDRPTKNSSVRIDIGSTLTVSAGLFGVVDGLTNAGNDSWTSIWTTAPLAAGVLLLVSFVILQTRVTNPLLPLRTVLDRNRAGSLLATTITLAGLLGVTLFAVYYVQGALRWSAVTTGFAFLPQTAALILTATVIGPRLGRIFGAKVLMPAGLIIAGTGTLLLTGLGVTADYSTDILIPLLLLGVGMGLFAPTATGLATQGLLPSDVGVGSALVGTGQQIGGSIGVALLNTVATSSAAAYIADRSASALLPVEATVHGYTAAFLIAAIFYAAAALIAGLMLRPRPVGASSSQTSKAARR